MTIEREHFNGPITLYCDAKRCAEYVDTECTDFASGLAKAKSRGWKAKKVGDEWEHRCPEHATRAVDVGA